jgi:hypothetical protein
LSFGGSLFDVTRRAPATMAATTPDRELRAGAARRYAPHPAPSIQPYRSIEARRCALAISVVAA